MMVFNDKDIDKNPFKITNSDIENTRYEGNILSADEV